MNNTENDFVVVFSLLYFIKKPSRKRDLGCFGRFLLHGSLSIQGTYRAQHITAFLKQNITNHLSLSERETAALFKLYPVFINTLNKRNELTDIIKQDLLKMTALQFGNGLFAKTANNRRDTNSN